MIAILILCYFPRCVLSRIVLLCAVGGSVLAAGCGGAAEEGDSVVAAFYPLAYAAREIAPEGTTVSNLTPPGAEPHDLELTARDVERLRDASLVIYVGGGFQPAVEDALAGRNEPELDVLDAVALLPGAAPGHEEQQTEHGGEELDPHVWLDPLRYAAVVRSIAGALGRPQSADPLVERLEVLDRELERGLAHCERREIVTSHAAFGYLAARYGLEQVPLVGVTPEAEPSAGDLEQLVEEVRGTGVSPEAELRPAELEEVIEHVEETGATTVFFETLVSPRLAETVARETGARTAVLNPVEGLTPEQEEDGIDYFDLMRENLATLRQALECR
jgi:zinc transport system substrate-binding protein